MFAIRGRCLMLRSSVGPMHICSMPVVCVLLYTFEIQWHRLFTWHIVLWTTCYITIYRTLLSILSSQHCETKHLLWDCRLSFTERDGSSLPGCRSTPFVWYAVQTTSEIVTHWPARCPSVAVFSCWRPSFRGGWCSTMEQSATWHRREWHTVTFPSWTQNIFI